jgi:hypothetical protein
MQGYFDIVDDATKERKRDISEYVPLSRVGDVVIKVEYGVEKVKSVGSRRRCGSEDGDDVGTFELPAAQIKVSACSPSCENDGRLTV